LAQAITLALLLAGFPVVNASQNAADESAPVAALRDRIELAYQARDLVGMEAARHELLAAAAGPDTARAPYYAAYARFRQGLVAANERDHARGYLDDCIRELDAFVERHPGDAEARALLGSCYGISTRYHKLALASRGLEARKHMAAARELAPRNPWVMLQDGLADYATPRFFGGDRDLAITKLEGATALFAVAMQAGSRIAAWGAAEAWQQLGEMYREAGRAGDARVAFETARNLAPRRAAGSQQLAAAL
jgi:tetratricopeptide (TPR) repeat protein